MGNILDNPGLIPSNTLTANEWKLNHTGHANRDSIFLKTDKETVTVVNVSQNNWRWHTLYNQAVYSPPLLRGKKVDRDNSYKIWKTDTLIHFLT